jgi:23S rRNA pseudouridine955/2504/2580 synthase
VAPLAIYQSSVPPAALNCVAGNYWVLTSMEAARRFETMSPSVTGRELVAGPDDAGRRLDKILRVVLKDSSLSEIYAALRKGRIRVNGRKAEPERRLEEGDRIFLHSSLRPAVPSTSMPNIDEENLGQIADILILATKDILFVNKPRGELSQGSNGIEGRIRSLLSKRMEASLSFVPGPLHRLDRNTTGVLAFPRSAKGARVFTAMLRERSIVKRYLALVDGEVSENDAWRDRIARDEATMTSAVSEKGDDAYAEISPLLAYGGQSLLLIELHSGLTHQIRVQASARSIPLSGDTKYGGEPFTGGYILHALSLEFPEPLLGDLPRLLTAPLPADARDRLAAVFGAEALQAALGRVHEA